MKYPLRLASIAVAALVAASVARGSAEVVLQDGQVVKGTEVRRDGDSFLITLATGGVVTFPASLVTQVRLGGEAEKPTPPPGLTYAEPQVLAGQHVEPPRTGDQLAVLGEPSKFAQAPTDPNWHPEDPWQGKSADNWAPSEWAQAPTDPNWHPEPAWDPAGDVLADGKSTWQKAPTDPSWAPTDAFRKKTSFVLRQGPPALAATSTTGPWACGERIFSPDRASKGAELQVKRVEDPTLAKLGLPLFEAEGDRGGTKSRAVFSVAGGECRIVGGDLDALLGVDLTPDHAVSLAAASYGSAVGAAGPALQRTGDALEYAFALVSLADPEVSGEHRARIVLLANGAELEDIARKGKKEARTCADSRWKRRKELKRASKQVAIPKIATGLEGEVATFYTWSSAGGAVFRNEVYTSKAGTLSVHRETIAAHVGTHDDPK